ncbi:MAG: hypothetical protein ACRDAX_05245 [Propionibacteriaceae bacterium]
MKATPKPHRPSFQPPSALEALAERNDPIARLHAAHETAAALLHVGHSNDDPEITRRIITVVDDIGLPTLADLWEARPAVSLPGALYRLYALREWVTLHPEDVAHDYAVGVNSLLETQPEITTEAPTPEALCLLVDTILHGAFTGDLADALIHAATFCHIIVLGRSSASTSSKQLKLTSFSEDLAACAIAWQRGDLR